MQSNAQTAHAVMNGFALGSARYFGTVPETVSLEHRLERERFLQDVWLEVWSGYLNQVKGTN
jgi:hypothetical protein